MKTTIEINATELASILMNNTDKIGSTDWDVYAYEDGRLDVRHNTYDNNDWWEIYDFYSAYDELGDDIGELADWLKSDGIDLNRLDDVNEYEAIEFVWAK